MEDKENNMNSLNTNESPEAEQDLDAFLMSMISHLYDAYSDSDSDSNTMSESETESVSTSSSDIDSESESSWCSDSSEKEMTILQFLDMGSSSDSDISILQFLDMGSSSDSDISNSVLREKTSSLEFLNQRIISQFFWFSICNKNFTNKFDSSLLMYLVIYCKIIILISY